MSIMDEFVREETATFDGGKSYWAEITNVEEKKSQAGNNMLVVTVKLNGAEFTMMDFIVKNEYFNSKVTKIMDCFGINETDKNILTWIGAIGYVKLKEDGDYLKVGKYIPLHQAEGEWEGEKPERMEVTNIDEMIGDEESEEYDTPF